MNLRERISTVMHETSERADKKKMQPDLMGELIGRLSYIGEIAEMENMEMVVGAIEDFLDRVEKEYKI